MHDCKCETIQAVLDTAMPDDVKLYWIKSYLLGWASEQKIQEVVSA